MSSPKSYRAAIPLLIAAFLALVILDRLSDEFLSAQIANSSILIEPAPRDGADSSIYWRVLGEVQEREYEFSFDASQINTSDPAIYLPAFQQSVKLDVNGKPLSVAVIGHNWAGPFSTATALYRFDAALLKPGENRLRIYLAAGPKGFAYIHSVRVGDYSQLERVALIKEFIAREVPKLLTGMLLLLAIIALIGVLKSPSGSAQVWVLFAAVPLLFHNANQLYLITTLAVEAGIFSFGLLPVTGWGVLAYVNSVSKRRVSRLSWSILALYLCAFILIQIVGNAEALRLFLFGITGPLFLYALLASLILAVRQYYLNAQTADLVLAFSVIMVIAAIVHDYLARSGIYRDWVLLWGPHLGSVLIIALSIDLLERGLSKVRLDRETRILVEAELALKEAELEAGFVARREAESLITVTRERSRILNELHDGVAGQLVLINTLADNPEKNSETLRLIAKTALADLRSVVNTLDIEETDLLYILGLFREKYLSQLERTGVKVDWNLLQAENIYGFNSSQALNLLRLLQEAANNSVKHAEVTRISVSLVPVESEGDRVKQFVLSFEDRGKHSFNPENLGIGIRSMSERAERLGATLDLVPLSTGVRIDLCLNVDSSRGDGLLWLDPNPRTFETV